MFQPEKHIVQFAALAGDVQSSNFVGITLAGNISKATQHTRETSTQPEMTQRIHEVSCLSHAQLFTTAAEKALCNSC